MATLLLVVIYVAFIGLGIPDSLFGTAWPAIYAEFQLPFSYGSFVSVVVSLGTIISSLLSAHMIKRFGTNRVAACSTLLTAAALILFSLAPNLWVMALLAVPLGVGAGAIDVALNNYVALHYSATHMSFLHCFYGVGVSVSPYVLSLVIGGSAGWRGGYRIAFFIQLAITVLLFATLPIWKKAHGGEKKADDAPIRALTFRQALRIPGVKLMCFLFIASCAIECSCGSWGATYLVEYRRLAADQAARALMLYYVGMTLGRFLSGVLASRLRSWTIIRIGEIVLGLALVVLFIPGSAALGALALFLIGLGNGPLFPNFNYLAPISFGAEVSQSIIGVQMASAYVGIMIAPFVCGQITQALGMALFPVYLMLFYLLMVPVTRAARRLLDKSNS